MLRLVMNGLRDDLDDKFGDGPLAAIFMYKGTLYKLLPACIA